MEILGLSVPEGTPYAVALLVLGLPGAYVVSQFLARWGARRYDSQVGLILGKLGFYPVVAVVLAMTLRVLGVSLTPFLGAAGIFGIAIGFASQTSVSNIISGFFLIGERAFIVDDIIQVGSTTGRVVSVDMLSIKIRAFDNRFIRIPNETLIKSELINFTRFPIRRIDIPVGIAYRSDPERARETLLGVAEDYPLALRSPEPQVWMDGFGESSFNLRLTAWAQTQVFGEARNELYVRIRRSLMEEGIEIPFPHRTLVFDPAANPEPRSDRERDPSTPFPEGPPEARRSGSSP